MANSMYDIIYPRLFQLLVLSRYFTGMKVSYFSINCVKKMQQWNQCSDTKHTLANRLKGLCFGKSKET